jgi:ABC-type transport system involved in cytochrome c biogenesis permease subunit
MKVLRSIASVVGCYLVVFFIVRLSDPVLERIFPGQYVQGKVPPMFVLWISAAVFAAASLVGGWLSVRIAPAQPGRHLLALFILGEAIGVIFTIVNPGHLPLWNSLLWLAIWPVFLWMGGRARGRRDREAREAVGAA